jgi:GxxExxY protein
LRGFHVATQLPLPITYKGVKIELGYRADLLVDNAVLVELKAVRKLVPLHEAQLLSYLN